MIGVVRKTAPGAAQAALIRGTIASSGAVAGRALLYRSASTQANPTYRAISQLSSRSRPSNHPSLLNASVPTRLPDINPLWSILLAKRAFSTTNGLWQQQQQERTNHPESGEKTDTSSEQEPKQERTEKEKEKEGSSEEGDKKKTKEEPPPPPPHGDKTPWQVFTETLQTEFKASKEWNESTKALASSAHQFTESESVKRARAAYEAASSTATSTTSEALKKTGKVLGQGAAWTWDTPVVKGLRHGVSATGQGIEKVTRPVRETKVYKKAVGEVKEVIDDGSSSRYGGWVEKEERRKKRELRELQEAKEGKFRRSEPMEEDPKYVTIFSLLKWSPTRC
jgi:import inner membrane translocase subunit TIM44